MRGRKPFPVSILPKDRTLLQQIARSESLAWRDVRRARICLAVAAGGRIQTVAYQVQCSLATVRRTCRRYQRLGLTGLLANSVRSGRPARIAPLQQAKIIQLACSEPLAHGLHITHWASADLARQAVAEGIVPTISARTVRRILREVELQPHRTRFWKSARLNAQFLQRAVKVLWCYTYAEHLADKGFWVVCTDELPNYQVLERKIRRGIPGSIEQREYEYVRHGTVNVLVFLVVHNGHMEAQCVETKDAQHYLAELRRFRHRHRHLRGVYLIQDGDPSHTAGATHDYLAECRNWWRVRPTPPHASWLNQAESLLEAFEEHYLNRGSWTNKKQFMEHIVSSWPEYNRLYARPFDWQWTIPQMRCWFAEHAI
jgi:transposase